MGNANKFKLLEKRGKEKERDPDVQEGTIKVNRGGEFIVNASARRQSELQSNGRPW